jgi:hypothetical protein
MVVSLGVRGVGRDLDGWETAGALTAQIQTLVVSMLCEKGRVR